MIAFLCLFHSVQAQTGVSIKEVLLGRAVTSLFYTYTWGISPSLTCHLLLLRECWGPLTGPHELPLRCSWHGLGTALAGRMGLFIPSTFNFFEFEICFGQ